MVDENIKYDNVNNMNSARDIDENLEVETGKRVEDYILELLQKGIAKMQIKEQLSAVGWSEKQIDAAYSRALVEKGIPIPNEMMKSTFGKKSSTVEIAINFFSFILLAIVAIALGNLFYQIINKYFPDALRISYRSGKISTSAIHYSIAALIIGFPLYYASMKFWFHGFEKDSGKVETKLTKWLTYLILLVTSITIVGDLIVALFTFLQGEISMRFFLKALTIFVIAGIIFTFYYLERRKIQYRKSISSNIFKIFGTAVSIIVLMGIILGFVAGGSPATERKRGFDNQREHDLAQISNCVESYARKYKKLPTSLNELNKTSFSYCSNKKDPETKKAYGYRVITSSKKTGSNYEGEFELCANFSLASEDNISDNKYNYSIVSKWNKHTAGRNCDSEITVLDKIGETTDASVGFPIPHTTN